MGPTKVPGLPETVEFFALTPVALRAPSVSAKNSKEPDLRLQLRTRSGRRDASRLLRPKEVIVVDREL